MNKRFWDNPYQTELFTSVLKINNNEILLNDTIAYSFSGGQESDKAWINDIPIPHSRMEEYKIYYALPEAHGLNVGDSVRMTIDWPRRYKLMRLHFSAELILELVTKYYKLEKIGAHIAEHKARIDFVSDDNIKEIFPHLLSEFNSIIEKDLPIKTGYLDEAAQRRYWEIDGFAKVPCGGTHVKSTKEVGFVSLKRERPGKSIERIEIKLAN